MEGRGHGRMGALLCLEVDIDTSLIYLLLASMMLFLSPQLEKYLNLFVVVLSWSGVSKSDFCKILIICDYSIR